MVLMSLSTPARLPGVPGVTLMTCLNDVFTGFFAVPDELGLKLNVAV